VSGPVTTVDCLGRPCPVPVIELARAIAAAAPGEVVEVLSDDPASRHDVPAWCRMRGHDYLGEHPREVGAGYRVRRA
jgi:TusA-related sulfurtransferase